LFTLTPKTGFYHSNNEMAFLNGNITGYYPIDVNEPDGYVFSKFFQDGDGLIYMSGAGLQLKQPIKKCVLKFKLKQQLQERQILSFLQYLKQVEV
jgi:hypothetical protein